MLLEPGENVFVVERRLFEDDLRRHFVGQVEAVSEIGFRAVGYLFLHDDMRGQFLRKPNPRTRIFSFNNNIIINVLPADCELGSVTYEATEDGTMLTDKVAFELDVSEFNFRR